MSETTENTGGPSPTSDAEVVQPVSQMFLLAMGEFSQAFDARDYPECLNWLKQADSLTAGNDEAQKSHRDSYARLITACASKGITIALHCGNITGEHRELADVIDKAANALAEKHRSPALQADPVAAVILGFSNQLSTRLNRVLAIERGHTSAEKLDGVLDNLFDLIKFAVQLDRYSEEALPGICDRLASAAVAVDNADCNIGWIFSDWDKAELFCRRAAQWLSHNDHTPGKVDPDFDDSDAGEAIAALNKAAEAIKVHHKKKSKKLLALAEAALADTVCV